MLKKERMNLIAQLIFYFILLLTASAIVKEGGFPSIPCMVILGVLFGCLYWIEKQVPDSLMRTIMSVMTIFLFLVFECIYSKDWILVTMTIFILFWNYSLINFEEIALFRRPNLASFVILMLCYTVFDVMNYQETGVVCFWTVFFYLLMTIYYNHMNDMELFIEHRKETTQMNGGQMKSIAKRFFLLYTGAVGILLFFVTRLSYGILYQIYQKFLAKIFSGLISLFGKTCGTTYTGKEQDIDVTSTMIPLQQNHHVNYFLYYLQKCLFFLSKVVVVIVLIILVVLVIRAFFMRKEVEEEKQADIIEVREKLTKENKKEKRSFLVRRDKREQLRHLYKKNMRGFWKESAKKKEATTPKEQKELKEKSGCRIEYEVLSLYEKARYSEEEITTADLTTFKQQFK